MSHVFISYKREDEVRVGRLALALTAAGLDVWWDRGLPGGESWHANIESKLETAGCVIVVWSLHSVSQDGGYVREEARRGLSRNILVPVLLDPLAQLPLGFGEIQAIDLTRWRGERRDPFFQDLIGTVRAKLTHSPLPAVTGPTRRIARRILWGSVSGVSLATAALIAFNTFGLAARLCTLPGVQPGLADSCGAFGLGGQASRAERVAWESRPAGSCPALRAHVARFPTGAYRSQAADLLVARAVTSVDSWQATVRNLDLFEPAAAISKDDSAARAAALAQARVTAERLCRSFGSGTLYRFESSQPVAERWSCDRRGAGVACAMEGHAECQLQERRQTQTERCG